MAKRKGPWNFFASPDELGWKCDRFAFGGGEHWTHSSGTTLQIEHRSNPDSGGELRGRVNGGDWFGGSCFGELLERATAIALKAAL